MTLNIPLIVEPEQLEQLINTPNVLIVDLSKAENYQRSHIPNALFLDYAHIVRIQKPVMGLLPTMDHLTQVLSSLGIDEHTHVIAYDDEAGGKAARLLYTLDILGHKKLSLLNGGIFSWANEGFPLSSEITKPTPKQFRGELGGTGVATKELVLSHLKDKQWKFLDTRSPEEYTGVKVYAARGGHIPGAVNLDWTLTMAQTRNMRLKSPDDLRKIFINLGLNEENNIVSYCQTHHRSSHTYIVLKSLGFKHIFGYPGAWSDWGNDPTTPIEI